MFSRVKETSSKIKILKSQFQIIKRYKVLFLEKQI